MADENMNPGAEMAAENKVQGAGGPSTVMGCTHDPALDAGDAVRRARESTGQIGEDLRQAADRVKDTATATAQEVADRVKEQAKQTGDKIKEQSRSFLNEQKTRVGAEIHTYSAAARRAAEQLKGESDTNLAQYVSTAADRLDQLGTRIQERDLGELVDDVEDIARRRPEVFFGGLFVAGMAAARFLKASKQRRQRDRYNRNYELAPLRPSVAGSTMVTPGAWPPGHTGTETGGTI
jgi:cell division septum initiation protein DivIVA